MRLFLTAVLTLLPGLAAAQEVWGYSDDPDTDSFVASNIVTTFYHEAGHAFVDVLQIPVLGREEDAADTLMSLFMEQLWDADSALYLMYDVTYAYALTINDYGGAVDEESYADVHGLDQQRYYNAVCLYVGADPEARSEVAVEMGLPESRAEWCGDEFAQAQANWAAFLDPITPGDGTPGFVLADPEATDPITLSLIPEIEQLNGLYRLPVEVTVKVEPCGEANAFYYSGDTTITMCTEYAEEMLRLWEGAESGAADESGDSGDGE